MRAAPEGWLLWDVSIESGRLIKRCVWEEAEVSVVASVVWCERNGLGDYFYQPWGLRGETLLENAELSGLVGKWSAPSALLC